MWLQNKIKHNGFFALRAAVSIKRYKNGDYMYQIVLGGTEIPRIENKLVMYHVIQTDVVGLSPEMMSTFHSVCL